MALHHSGLREQLVTVASLHHLNLAAVKEPVLWRGISAKRINRIHRAICWKTFKPPSNALWRCKPWAALLQGKMSNNLHKRAFNARCRTLFFIGRLKDAV